MLALGVSERSACRVPGQHRSTRQKPPRGADGEAAPTAGIVEPARRYGRHGHRRATALLRAAGWAANHKRVERIRRREGLEAPPRRPKRGRLWLADGSCVRLRPERPRHVRAHDFVEDRTKDGRKHRMLRVVDESTREAPAIRVARKPASADVIDTLADLFVGRGVPAHVRSDQGPEFVAAAVKGWVAGVGAATACIEKGGPREDGHVEGFDARLRDELLDGEVFHTVAEARVPTERWRRHHNGQRPHPSPGHRPPAPEVLPFATKHQAEGDGCTAGRSH